MSCSYCAHCTGTHYDDWKIVRIAQSEAFVARKTLKGKNISLAIIKKYMSDLGNFQTMWTQGLGQLIFLFTVGCF